MEQKKQFIRPAMLQELVLLAESPILEASLADNTTVVSMGQDVETHDFAGDDFNHQWE